MLAARATLTATLGATLTATVSASLGPHAPLTPLLLPCPRQPLLQVPQVQLLRLTAQREHDRRCSGGRGEQGHSGGRGEQGYSSVAAVAPAVQE